MFSDVNLIGTVNFCFFIASFPLKQLLLVIYFVPVSGVYWLYCFFTFKNEIGNYTLGVVFNCSKCATKAMGRKKYKNT